MSPRYVTAVYGGIAEHANRMAASASTEAQRGLAESLKSAGAIPVQRLNAREKVLGSEKPNR